MNADNSSIIKQKKRRIKFECSADIIKYLSSVMQGKRKLCECHTRFCLVAIICFKSIFFGVTLP